MRRPALLSLVALTALLGCGCDGGPAATTCDPSERPIVLAHGLLAASDTWQSQALRLRANGYCDSHVRAFDWNTIDQSGAEDRLDAFIDATLADTGATQVDLVGHSAGGALGYRYLSDPAHAAKVAHYAHVASPPSDPPGPAGPAGAPLPTLNVWSEGDEVVDSGDVAGVVNAQVAAQDHYQVATSSASFEAIWAFLHDGAAPKTTALDDSGAELSGKALSLGENTPVAGGEVRVFEVDPATARRLSTDPIATFTIASDGAWGPFAATRGASYELLLIDPTEGARPVHYYLEPTFGVRRFVVLRSLPTAGLVAALLAAIPYNDAHSVVIAFSSSQAVIHGRDTLTFDALDLATEALASPAQTAIAYFLFDDDEDGVSSGPTETFSAIVPFFLDAVDAFIPADAAATSTLTFNGRTLTVARWPSDSDGPVVAIFD